MLITLPPALVALTGNETLTKALLSWSKKLISLTEPERPKPLGQHHSVRHRKETTPKLCGAKTRCVCVLKKKQQNQIEIQATTLKSSLEMLLKRLQEHQTKPRGICNWQNCYGS